MAATAELYSRRTAALVREALVDNRVVVVNGARQVGKSTMAQLVAGDVLDGRGYFLDDFFLDDAVVRAAAEADPPRGEPTACVRMPLPQGKHAVCHRSSLLL